MSDPTLFPTQRASAQPRRLRVHNGTFTVKHPRRGHVTIKLYTEQHGNLAGKRILAMLVGPNNTTDYRGVAFWNDDRGIVSVWKRFRGQGSYQPIDGYRHQHAGWSDVERDLAIWCDLATRGARGFYAHEGYELLLESRCARCNRALTTPESIELGLGPECAGKF